MKKAIITLAFLLISLLASAQTPVDMKTTGENTFAVEYVDTLDGKPLSMAIEYDKKNEKKNGTRKLTLIDYDGVVFLCSLDAKNQQDDAIRIWTDITKYSKNDAKVIVDQIMVIVGHTQRPNLEDTMTKLVMYLDSCSRRRKI